MEELIRISKIELEKLNEELAIKKSDAERLSIYIDDAIQAEDYEEAGDCGNLLKDTCIRIANLSSRIEYLDRLITHYSK